LWKSRPGIAGTSTRSPGDATRSNEAARARASASSSAAVRVSATAPSRSRAVRRTRPGARRASSWRIAASGCQALPRRTGRSGGCGTAVARGNSVGGVAVVVMRELLGGRAGRLWSG
jgi:hypothetical protein